MDLVYSISQTGIGSFIGNLSMLANNKGKINLLPFTGQENALLVQKYFEFPNVEVVPYEGEWSENFVFSENAKLFDPYPEFKGERFTPSSFRIGTSFFKDKESAVTSRQIFEKKYYPNNRYAGKDKCNLLVDKIKGMGIDHYSFDEHEELSFELKLKEIQQCSLIICYEGGIAHLAHCLGVPVLMYEWHTERDPVYINPMDDGSYPPNVLTHSLHLDKKTWFYRSFDDLLYLKKEDLEQKSQDLSNDLGNNMFLKQESINFYRMKYYDRRGWPHVGLRKNVQLDGLIGNLRYSLNVPRDIWMMVKDKYTNLKLGGIVPVIYPSIPIT